MIKVAKRKPDKKVETGKYTIQKYGNIYTIGRKGGYAGI